jgi:hypothetical protein
MSPNRVSGGYKNEKVIFPSSLAVCLFRAASLNADILDLDGFGNKIRKKTL